MCVLSCTKSQQVDRLELVEDRFNLYINKASDNRVPYKERLACNEKAQELLLKLENDSLTTNQLFAIAINFQKLNSLEQFKRALLIGLRRSQEQENLYHIAVSYFYLGNYYKEIRSNDSAFYFYLKAERQFLKSKNNRQLADLYLDKSSVQIDVFDIFGAEKSAVNSLKYCKIIGDKLGEYDALINLGIASNSSEDYPKANYYYNKAIDLIFY